MKEYDKYMWSRHTIAVKSHPVMSSTGEVIVQGLHQPRVYAFPGAST